MMMPAPESRSTPAASMSMAVLVRAVRILEADSAGLAALINAAIAAACGAAAEVPKNGEAKKPTPVTETPSAAVKSGFWSTRPPVEEKFPGVNAVLLARKKIRRGPSELKVSTVLAPVNGFPDAIMLAS